MRKNLTGSGSNDRFVVEDTVFIGVFGTVIFLCSQLLLYHGTARASLNLHQDCLHRILRCPSSFFDSTPIGRIISRFSNDIYVIDCKFTIILSEWIECLLEVMYPSSFDIIFRSFFFFLFFPLDHLCD